jgi:hypothetical protein
MNSLALLKSQIRLLQKEAIDGSTDIKNSALMRVLSTAGTIGGTALGVAAADELLKSMGEQFYKVKIPGYIRYAKQKHPELKEVGENQLKMWVEAIYTIAPNFARNKELMADALYQIYQYGGNIDLATAKMLADVNKGAGSSGRGKLDYITAAHTISNR